MIIKDEIWVNEEKVLSGDISICYADQAFMDKIRDEMMMNLEEEWDIQNSIREIKELEKSNKEQILVLANEMEDLIEQKEQIS